jgi:hypothetical protein
MPAALVASSCMLAGCSYAPAPVRVMGEPLDLQALAGEWEGSYHYDGGTRRSGTILFRLTAESDTARGDVLMIVPGAQPSPVALPAVGDPWIGMAPEQKILSINFVRASAGAVSGAMDPYTDPGCGCVLTTTFHGRLVADRVEGSFSARRVDTGEVQRGHWSAVRRGSAAGPDPGDRLDLTLSPDQARITLEILGSRAAEQAVPDSLWAHLFGTEGHRRVMERERGMDAHFGQDRGITEAAFRKWAESEAALDSLAERHATLDAWLQVDLVAAGRLALAYLPDHARLRGTIYPLVREQRNSFIWDAGAANPAIFMAVEPGVGLAALEHILAHELHHIGAAGACAGSAASSGSPEAQQALRWMGGFGEGLAVLAAAGGVGRPTHPYDSPEGRRAWAVRLDSLQEDMAELGAFFTAILAGQLTGEEAGQRGFEFISRPGAPQGAFYSVGWHMASAVERAFGREAVVSAVCDPASLLIRYQEAAASRPGDRMPTWSSALMEQIPPLTLLPSPRDPPGR